jgi:hypothetical protein
VRRSLPGQEGETAHPRLYSLRDEYEVARLDEHFGFGLELLLRGLSGYLESSTR